VVAVEGSQQSCNSITDAKREDADDCGRLTPPQNRRQSDHYAVGHGTFQQLSSISCSTYHSHCIRVLEENKEMYRSGKHKAGSKFGADLCSAYREYSETNRDEL